MGSITYLFSSKVPDKLSLKNEIVWYNSTKRFRFKWGKVLCHLLLYKILDFDKLGVTNYTECVSAPLNYAVGWNDQATRFSRLYLIGSQ